MFTLEIGVKRHLVNDVFFQNDVFFSFIKTPCKPSRKKSMQLFHHCVFDDFSSGPRNQFRLVVCLISLDVSFLDPR